MQRKLCVKESDSLRISHIKPNICLFNTKLSRDDLIDQTKETLGYNHYESIDKKETTLENIDQYFFFSRLNELSHNIYSNVSLRSIYRVLLSQVKYGKVIIINDMTKEYEELQYLPIDEWINYNKIDEIDKIHIYRLGGFDEHIFGRTNYNIQDKYINVCQQD